MVAAILLLFACGSDSIKVEAAPKENQVPSNGNSPAKNVSASSEVVADETLGVTGKSAYQRMCQQCHQSEGQGILGLYPPGPIGVACKGTECTDSNCFAWPTGFIGNKRSHIWFHADAGSKFFFGC